MTKGFYSLIQSSPDIARQEFHNIGLIVFRAEPRFVDVRLSEKLGISTATSEDIHPDLLWATRRAFANRLEQEAQTFSSVEDLANFRASGTNPLKLTLPREVMLHDPIRDTQDLFEDLVG